MSDLFLKCWWDRVSRMALLDQERDWGREFQRARQCLSSSSSGDSRWEVNFANTPETGHHIPINASFAGEQRKTGDGRGCQSAAER